MAPSWSSLRLACKIAKPRTNKAIRPWGDLCWISAIHAVYNRNLTEVQKGLGCLVDELNPSMWLTTTHSNKSGLLWTLWPTNDVTYIRQVKSNADVTARFDGICQTISNWRIRLRSNISNVRDVIMKRNGFPIREYLDNSVSWKWPNMAIMWYEDNHT